MTNFLFSPKILIVRINLNFMKKAVIFDIDGVLAEKSPERDYREYNKVHLDKYNKEYFKKLESKNGINIRR